MKRRFFAIFASAAAVLAMQAGEPAYAQAAGQPKVAVYNFRDPSSSGVAPELREMIITAIINTRKFNVFSRDFSSAEEEQQLERGKKVASKGKTVADSVDYSIEGSITGSQAGTEVDNSAATAGVILGIPLQGCSKQTISISVDVVIKQLATQRTPYAQSLTRNHQGKCKASGSAVDLPALMRSIANQLAFEFATEIYPVKVIAVQPDGSMLLNYGEEFLKPGTFLQVTSPTTEIESDGIMVKAVGSPIGRAQVVDVNAATARAVMEHGRSVIIPDGSIIRIDPDQKPSKAPKGKK